MFGAVQNVRENLVRAWISTRSPGLAAEAVLAGLLILLAGCSEKSTSLASGGNAPMLIEPHVSVGKLRAGMTAEQTIKELGEPDRRTATALEYSRLGLAVISGPQGEIQGVMCGDVTGINGPFTKAFTGRTKEGIGMNSTRDEVIRAYGEPTRQEKIASGIESLIYPNLGITFTLERGHLHHMAVRLSAPAEPDRSVTLEPASPEKK